MPNGITKETFVDADEKTRIALTFELLSAIHDHQCKQVGKCEKRFKALENRKNMNSIISGVGGMIGGVAFWLGEKLVGK